jgi:hypothetical protein
MKDIKQFKFLKHDNIGAADAIDDEFLSDCFVDTGDIAILEDCGDPRSLVVGRTGSGKTALLRILQEKQQKVISIPPESLSLSYISNSTILNFVAELGVNLDIFYRLLWRHVFTVELLKNHFQINSEEAKRTFLQKFGDLFKNQKQKKALEYLENWGKEFWQETEYRIKEITNKLESEIQANIGTTVPGMNIGIGALKKLTEDQKSEIVKHSQEVVNKVQIRQLSDIIDLIDEVLTDPQKKYYILIDRLDEGWIEDTLRYKLIRALIETIKDFRKVRFAKIIIAVRQDLLERVFRLVRSAGFQEEKYESMYLRVSWSKTQLAEIMDKRLNRLIQSRYTSQKIQLHDILPSRVESQESVDYILERTMMQPRDVIHFINKCIQQAIDRKGITATLLKSAEGEYSRDRLRYLADEWAADYPDLIEFVKILRESAIKFTLKDIMSREGGEFCLNYTIEKPAEPCAFLSSLAREVAHGNCSTDDFVKRIFQVFYKTGIVGLKIEAQDTYIWSTARQKGVSLPEIDSETKIMIHPAFWRVLGVKIK